MVGCVLKLGALCAATAAHPAWALTALPQRLSETGLFVEGSTQQVLQGVLAYEPQFGLWTDGAAKRRWIYLPPGQGIDVAQADSWQFPAGTRLWKEFAFGRAVETRFMELQADGQWRYATYVWRPDGRDAVLAPVDGIADLPVPGAPGGRATIPSRADCLVCHDNGATPVLGFSALQLSTGGSTAPVGNQNSQAPQVDLPQLLRARLLRNVAPQWSKSQPDIPATDAVERAALGYLHGNCGYCHNDTGPLASLDLSLLQSADASTRSRARTLQTLLRTMGRYRDSAAPQLVQRVVAGDPTASILLHRMRSTSPSARMPPLGVSRPDNDATRLIERWIRSLSNNQPPGTTP